MNRRSCVRRWDHVRGLTNVVVVNVTTSWIALVSPTHDICFPASGVRFEISNHFLSATVSLNPSISSFLGAFHRFGLRKGFALDIQKSDFDKHG